MRSKKISEGLARIYHEVDDEMRGRNLACKACGRCCRFDSFDLVLYVSSVEFEYVAEHAPLLKPEANVNRCPYLEASGRCGIHDVRPLGCRTFFCSFRDRDAMQDIYNKYYEKIKDLSELVEGPWQYRPLLELLGKSFASRRIREGV
jgi:Fe-S-cluster containining protein